MCHITGGGLYNNLKRIIPDNLEIILNKINYPKWCKYLQEYGNIPDDEMTTIFNCGIGYVLVVNKDFYNTIKHLNLIEVGYLK
jgi:phosphoribosylaminoimidazole (AIR) synthetase